ncbi:MAG: hypothetical protein CVT49_08650 [candidate division Zixibacteria bacterium HGW-Zixibacteria-1]|nr:MAG: hypothetical protein CVT49_08650 [candidate division Zixibacteria bacterium HGW-Zixibacteria-1]
MAGGFAITPVTEEYREYIVERLQRVVPVRWRKMFGGLGIFYDRLPFALAADNTYISRLMRKIAEIMKRPIWALQAVRR